MINLKEIKSYLVNKNRFWIVFTGDSITSCEWVHPNWRDILIYVLKREIRKLPHGDLKNLDWGIRGFNFAYDGATTKDILGKIENLLLVKPQLTIGLMGGNDPTFNISVSEHTNNIKKITDKLISSGSKVVWCNSIVAAYGSKKNFQYKPYAEAVMKMKQSKDLQIIDMFNLSQKFPLERIFTFKLTVHPEEGIKPGQPDLEHPNQLGNAYIAKVILEKVFSIKFDPEKYIKNNQRGEKNPGY